MKVKEELFKKRKKKEIIWTIEINKQKERMNGELKK